MPGSVWCSPPSKGNFFENPRIMILTTKLPHIEKFGQAKLCTGVHQKKSTKSRLLLAQDVSS